MRHDTSHSIKVSVWFCIECIARIGHCKPLLISAVGGDDLGEMLLRQLELVRVVSNMFVLAVVGL